jgi:hypothetical protein
MATNYRVFVNNLAGGPIDYSTPLATVAGLSHVTAALPLSAAARFAVRAFDTVSGLEEKNTDATVSITLDAAGVDVSGVPPAVENVAAVAGQSGEVVVTWTWRVIPGLAVPTSFSIWATAGGSVNYAVAANATKTYVPGLTTYQSTITGLTAGAIYSLGVRAVNAAGTETGTESASLTIPGTTPPEAVDGLSAS